MADTSKEQGMTLKQFTNEVLKVNHGSKSIESLYNETVSAIRSDILKRADEKAITRYMSEHNPVAILTIDTVVLLSDLTALCTEDLTKEEKI